MATAGLGDAVRRVFDRVRDGASHGDGDLLTRYRTERDQEAFGSLVRRHGPMVLGVCRRVLRDSHAADDAFQATFLVLAKKAEAVRPPDRLAPWLYGVAYRTALKARGRAFRRRQVEQDYAAGAGVRSGAAPACEAGELLPVIDEQLNGLPEKYRTPLLLCGVQGLNKAEAAQRLGLPEGTVSSRLARARDMLRDRLVRRGVAVPAAFAALLTPDALQAAVTQPLTASACEVALGSVAVPETVFTLSHEVIRSMTLSKFHLLSAIALSASLAGGGFGLLSINADEKKPQPAQAQVKKPAPEADKPAKPSPEGDKKPVKPDGEKKPGPRFGGKVAAVDAKEGTITLAIKGDGGLAEKVVKVPAGAKVLIDGKEAKLADVPKGSIAGFMATAAKEGVPPDITEVRVTGASVGGTVKSVDASGITLDSEKAPQAFKLTADTKVSVGGKDAKPTDLKAGDRVNITLSADGASALAISGGAKGEGGDKPEGKPGVKVQKFGGRVASVDASARTITLASKGEGGKEVVVKVTADAKVTVDGKDAKLGDVARGVTVTLTIASAKDGQLREVNEVVVAGITFGGTVKQVDTTSVTIGSEKSDRVLKLAPGAKVVINGKEAKLTDLKVGDRAMATLTSDETAAVVITVGGKRPEGDKPKPEKEEQE